jgi:predicted transcriptional regulator
MTQVQEKVLRDFTLSVRLRPDMREKLGMVADSLGVSPATVASMAIGQYVANQHTAFTAAERTGKAMMEAMTAMLAGKESQPQPESEKPCSSSSAPSVQLPLLAAAPTKKPGKSSPSATSSRSKRKTTAGLSK